MKIETWNLEELKDYTHYLKSKGENPFHFLNPEMVEYIMSNENYNQYSEETELSPLEIQADRTLENKDYHKALVSLEGDEVRGVLVCEWMKRGTNFWRYKIANLEAHKDFRNQRIATNLIKYLDQADFLQGKILQRGLLTSMGKKYTDMVMKRELKFENYALIPSEFMSYNVPKKPGKYGVDGV